jgi:hypothetical protein
VFKQMGKTRTCRIFIPRTDIISNVDGYQWRRNILMRNNGQAIGQYFSFKVDQKCKI